MIFSLWRYQSQSLDVLECTDFAETVLTWFCSANWDENQNEVQMRESCKNSLIDLIVWIPSWNVGDLASNPRLCEMEQVSELFFSLLVLQAMRFCNLWTAWAGVPNINNRKLYNQMKKLILPPFQISFKKERAFKTVKLWKVDSAQGILVRMTNNLLGSTPDKWCMLVLFDQNVAVIWVVMASCCLVRSITQLQVLFNSSRCSVLYTALCFISTNPHSVFILQLSDFSCFQ